MPIRYLELDDSLRLSPEALTKQIAIDLKDGLSPWLLAVSAGTVNTGAVDPIDELAEICQEFGVWLHVDGAYGGFFNLTDHPKAKPLRAISKADSIILVLTRAYFYLSFIFL